MSIFVNMRAYAINAATMGSYNYPLMRLFRWQNVYSLNDNPFRFFRDVVPHEPCLIVLNDVPHPPNATKVLDPCTFAKHLMAFVDLYRPASCTVVCAQSRGKQFAESVREVLAEAARVHHHLPLFSSLVVEGLTVGAGSWSPPQCGSYVNLNLWAWTLTKLVGHDNTWFKRFMPESAYSEICTAMAMDAMTQYELYGAIIEIDLRHHLEAYGPRKEEKEKETEEEEKEKEEEGNSTNGKVVGVAAL